MKPLNYEFNLLDHVCVLQKGGGIGQALMTGRTEGQPDGQTIRELNAFARFTAEA